MQDEMEKGVGDGYLGWGQGELAFHLRPGDIVIRWKGWCSG